MSSWAFEDRMAKRVDKPVRLYVLTIFIVVAYGLMPFVSVFFIDTRQAFYIGLRNLPFNGSPFVLYDADGNADPILVSISVLLCLFSISSSLWAFYGDSAGRIATLFFLTLDVVWWIGIVVFALTFAEAASSDKLSWVTQLIGPPIWLGFVWWNFTRPDISAYYRYVSESTK